MLVGNINNLSEESTYNIWQLLLKLIGVYILT